MALKRIVHCIVDKEPDGYHTEGHWYAVNLSFEVERVAAQEGGAEQDAGARATNEADASFFKRFLAALGDVEFIAAQTLGNAEADPLDPAECLPVSVQLPAPNPLLAWLDDRARENPESFWISRPPADGNQLAEIDIEADDARASDLLRAVQSWNAPVGHRLGLTRLIRFDSPLEPGWVVVPKFGELASPVALDTTNTLFQIDYTQPTVADYCRTHMPALLGAGVSGLLRNGCFKTKPEAEQLRRLLTGFEQRAAVWMDATSPLSGLDKPPPTPPQDGALPAAPIPGMDTPVTHLSPLVCWAIVSGLTTALDMLLLSLLKPVSKDRSEGDVLSPLVSAILDQTGTTSDVVPSAMRIAQSIRELILAVLPTSNATEPTLDDRNKLAHLLCRLHIDVSSSEATPEVKLLDLALDAYVNDYAEGSRSIADSALKAWIDGGAGSKSGVPLDFLLQPVFNAQAKLQGEAGMEDAILRLFRHAASPAQGEIAAVAVVGPWLAGGLSNLFGISGQTEEGRKNAFNAGIGKAWGQYVSAMDAGFNGLEAVRRSTSAEFVEALLPSLAAQQTDADEGDHAEEGDRPSQLDSVIKAIRGAQYHRRRLLDRNDTNPFSAIITSLPTIKFPDNSDTEKTPLGECLTAAYTQAIKDLDQLSGTSRRFVPDVTPQPLAVQIAANFVADNDEFLKNYNGIALAIRRIDHPGNTAQDEFAHANLAALSFEGATENVTIRPFMPVGNDGRAPLFVEYHGFPLADTGLSEVMAEASSYTGKPFYSADLADPDTVQLPRLPALAYGRNFQAVAFATSNAGTLPLAFRDGAAEPWLPGRITIADTIPSVKCSRRTAIGEIGLVEVDGAKKLPLPEDGQRIGRAIDGVVPLSADYPRTSLVAPPHASSVLDLWRDADGEGLLVLAVDGDVVEVVLNDVRISSLGTASLELCIFDNQADDPDAQGKAYIPISGDKTSFRLQLRRSTPGSTQVDVRFFPNNDTTHPSKASFESSNDRFWLRLRLDNSTENAVAFSVATPDDSGSARNHHRLLLLRPEGNGWRDKLPDSVAIRLSAPRIGYLDFMRCMANVDLKTEILGDSAETWLEALRTAYAMRHLDGEGRLAQLLDALPDPLVDGMRVTWAATDGLFDQSGQQVPTKYLNISLTEMWTSALSNFLKPDVGWTPETLKKHLDAFVSHFEKVIAVKTQQQNDSLVLYLPAGHIASLRIESLVLSTRFMGADGFPPIFDCRLLQYASGKDTGHVAFASASLTVECMMSLGVREDIQKIEEKYKPIELAGRFIDARSVGDARHYDLVARAPADKGYSNNIWRLFSHVDTHSQRWRPSGRPMYRSLQPKALKARGQKGDVAFRIDEKEGKEQIHAFEDEVFFDRPDFDADTVTQKLDPWTTPTVLASFPWDASSATYWRHRFTLRSRYAGALAGDQVITLDAFPADASLGNTQRWTLRVVMLADPSRVQLTRPQLRALIPLTTAVDGTTPPVLAVLQEPPFAVGGLADRIAADLKTGFGYGFSSPPDAPAGEGAVEITDARKQIGPDPRLSYQAMPATTAQSMVLSAEGPIGLTFDPPHARAPAFANSMWLLAPISLSSANDNCEEHFIGASLQRYLDPAWTSGEAENDSRLRADASWWLTLERASPLKASHANYEHELLLWDGDTLSVTRKILGESDAATVPIAHIPEDTVTLHVLHQPFAPGRYSATVFVPSNDAKIEQGRSATPLIAASFEWSTPDQSDEPPTLSGYSSCSPVSASAATPMAWTRTNRDFSNVRVGDADRNDSGKQIRVDALHATATTENGKSILKFFEKNSNAGSLHLVSSTQSSRFPLHVQRHLACLVTKLRNEPGRRTEEYLGAWMLTGTESSFVGVDHQDRLLMRLVELEVPSAVLGPSSNIAIPETYKQHYFDLKTTCDDPSALSELGIIIRLAGLKQHLQTLDGLDLIISSKRSEISIGITKTAMRSVEIRISKSATSIAVNYRVLDLDGKFHAPVGVQVPDDQSFENLIGNGFHLSFKPKFKNGDGEVWIDASLLHQTGAATDSDRAFHFDWLFSGTAGLEPKQALAPSAMKQAVEAQARIVAVSPPFPLEHPPE